MSAIRNGTFAIKEPSDPAGEESLSSQTHTETLRILTFSALAVSSLGTLYSSLTKFGCWVEPFGLLDKHHPIDTVGVSLGAPMVTRVREPRGRESYTYPVRFKV